MNSVTDEGIYDVKFLLYDQNKNPIGQYSTDNEGYIYIDDLTVQGKGDVVDAPPFQTRGKTGRSR